MFIVKKLVTPFLIPPGIFIVILLLTGYCLWRRNLRKYAVINIAIGLMLWGVSINPASVALMRGLEADLAIPRHIQGDVIILLGGGINEGVPDLTGSGTPSDDMMARVVTAVRIQRRLDVPVIVSGGSVFAGRGAEAPVIRRFLIDLGVREKQVLLESRSRDTMENATYCRDIIRKHGFRHPLLVTSAYHMRRSIKAFQRAGVAATPVPAQFATGGALPWIWSDLLPGPVPLLNSAKALREYWGLLFYRVSVWVQQG